MKAIIKPSKINKSIAAPPSKSMAHRLIIAAALADGSSVVHNVAMSEDIKATIRCLTSLGAEIKELPQSPDELYLTLQIRGVNPSRSGSAVLDAGESGSTLRFMIPIAALSNSEMRFIGSETLMNRPLSVYEDISKSKDLEFERKGTELRLKGALSGGIFEIPGNISSQFVTGLLMALPLAEEDSIIKLIGDVESKPYIDMSIDALSRYGISIEWEDERTLSIPGGQTYSASEQRVEGDWSNAAYLMALGAEVNGLDDNSLQGDRLCKDYFSQIRNGYCELDIHDCPDLGPALMAYAALNKGCVLHGTKRLRIKESDRGTAMQQELRKFGVESVIYDDDINVGCGITKPTEALQGHNDHRIVMALSGICLITGGIIEGAEAVNKSYPDFFDRIEEAGAHIEKEILR